MQKTDSIETLRCPACLGRLQAREFESAGSDGDGWIESGVLLCEACGLAYPIAAATPVMLRFSTPFHRWFARTHADRLRALSEYALPAGEPRPGEAAVQETFTDQWNLMAEDELSFAYTLEELVELNRRVWLPWVDELPSEERPKRVLDVGCGVGMEAMALREATGASDLYAIDLNFALLSRRPEYRRRPGVTFVVASLFDLPFEAGAFDLVYSQGVLHHTYSTHDGFRSIASRVRPGGHLFVWLYGLEDHLAPGGHRVIKRARHIAELLLRPAVTRAPRRLRDAIFKVAAAIWHLRRRTFERHRQSWKRENTEHALRDWLSPRYAYRHGYNEVAEWFESAGFGVVGVQSPTAYRELFDTPLWGVGLTGRRSPEAGSEREAGARRERAHA